MLNGATPTCRLILSALTTSNNSLLKKSNAGFNDEVELHCYRAHREEIDFKNISLSTKPSSSRSVQLSYLADVLVISVFIQLCSQWCNLF